MKKIFTAMLLTAMPAVFAGNILTADFNTQGKWSVDNQGTELKPMVRGEASRPTAPGVTGSAAWFAAGNCADFPGGTEGKVIGTLRYNNIKNFPQQAGFIRMYVAPYFNGIPRKNSKNHNYIFRFFNTKGPAKVITAFFYDNRRIDLQITLADGKMAYLSAPVSTAEAKKFMKLDIVWKPGLQQLYINGKLAAEKYMGSSPLPVNAMELGGVDNFGPFMLQGVIDDLTVSDTAPADLKLDTKKKTVK